MKNKNQYFITKSNNNSSIKVLYKRPKQIPEVKIINNISNLKRTIITKSLLIIPYEKLFIICNNEETMRNLMPNIALTLRKICGDFILVSIDKKTREFQNLSQKDIEWYSSDLVNKSFNDKPSYKRKFRKNKKSSFDSLFGTTVSTLLSENGDLEDE